MKKNGFLTGVIALMMCGITTMTAQVTIGSDKSPEKFSVLELISNNTHGLRLPQIETTADRDRIFTNAVGFKGNEKAEGLTIFNLQTKCWEVWNGTVWISLCGEPPLPTYTATLDPNGGDLNGPPTITAGTDGKITQPNDPTPPVGKKFDYWEDANTGLPFDFNTPITDNVNLIAKYSDLTATLDPNGGTLNGPSTLTAGTDGKITKPNDPTPPAGKEFLYWEDANTGLPFDFNTPITDDVNLIAKYCTLITPTFTQVAPICAGGTFALPASNNGITGNWSPAINTAATTTYTFTPDAGQCATTATMTVTVTPTVTPTVTISTTTGNNLACSGNSVIFTATPTNGGTSPIYLWKVNGSTVGTNSATYSYIPSNGDIVSCILTSNAACASPTTASDQLTMEVVTFSQPNPPSTLEICPANANNITLAASNPVADTYLWERSSDGINWAPAPAPNGAATYNIPAGTLSSDWYYRRNATIDCGTKTSSAVLVIIPHPVTPTFYPINLGANPALNTPFLQMQYLASSAYSSLTSTQQNQDHNVYGAMYQWGRNTDGHQLRTSTSLYIPADITYDANGQPTNYTTDFLCNNVGSDWTNPQRNDLWGNGFYPNVITPGGGQPGMGGNAGNTYQQGVKTVNDPCPAGYRVPTQDEWETWGNYCDASAVGGNAPTLSGIWNTTTGYTWVAVVCGGGQATVSNSGWAIGTPGGYAVYRTSDWNALTALGVASGTDLLSNPAYTNNIIMFLPATGQRAQNNGAITNVGRSTLYWSSSINGVNLNVYVMTFSATSVMMSPNDVRSAGHTVRCVAE